MGSTTRTVIVFGAGNIGLSFVGQIFARSGYRVVFSDVDKAVLTRIEREGGYTVGLIDPDGTVTEIAIDVARTIPANDSTEIRKEMSSGATPPVIATAVGVRAFPLVLKTLSRCAPADRPLALFDLIAAENIHDPVAIARETLGERAPAVHACAVGKMVPRQSLAVGDGPLRVRAEAFNTLYADGTEWRSSRPEDVEGLELVPNIDAWMDRKLSIHNMGHSACAWIARQTDPSREFLADAIGDPEIRRVVEEAMLAAAEVVAQLHPDTFTFEQLRDHVSDLIRRFGNRALGDTVERVGQDIRRKLRRDDRLVGCMLGAARHLPSALPSLAAVYRAALGFGVAGVSGNEDDIAIAQDARTVREVALELSGLDPAHADHAAVLRAVGAITYRSSW